MDAPYQHYWNDVAHYLGRRLTKQEKDFCRASKDNDVGPKFTAAVITHSTLTKEN